MTAPTAAQPELLPLPEPLLEFAATVGGKRIDYTADHMQAYARTAVSAALQAQAGEVEELRKALNAMLTHMGMDEDEWNKPTFDQARAALKEAAP